MSTHQKNLLGKVCLGSRLIGLFVSNLIYFVIDLLLDHINVFKLFQYFIHIRHHPTVCSCGLAARLFGILVFVANANSVFFFHKKEAKLKTFKHSFSRTGVKVWNLIPDHFMFLGNCPPTPPLSQHFALREK